MSEKEGHTNVNDNGYIDQLIVNYKECMLLSLQFLLLLLRKILKGDIDGLQGKKLTMT